MPFLALTLVLLLVAYTSCCNAAEEHMKLHSDMTLKHDWSSDPINIDHGFIHHRELFDAIRDGVTKFDAYDVFHTKRGIENGHDGGGTGDVDRHPFLNLGDIHRDGSRLYDTKTTFELEDGTLYLDLDHNSARMHRIDDTSMHICHDSSHKVSVGSYLLGTGEGEWINSDEIAKWISNTEHVGPRIKRKLAEGSFSTLGLAVSRVVTSVSQKPQENCVEVTTKTVHPNSIFKSMTIDSYFHAHSAHEASRYNSDHQSEEALYYDRRLNFLVDGNGVQYCDDTVEMNQRSYMTRGYNQWEYDKRNWGWYKGRYDVPSKLGGGEIMYLASLLSNGGSGCFMYMNSLEAFNWNADTTIPSEPKASTDPYILSGSSESGILCENCFAYLGARVRVVAEFQKKNSEVRFLAFIGGTAAAFAELQLNSYAKSISRSGTFIFPEPENGYKDVALGNTGIKFYWKGGGFGYELDGEVETEGQVRASAGIYADAYIFAAYGGKGGSGETFYVNKSASLDYHPPKISTSSDFSIKKASLRALITGSINFKIGRSLKVFGRELGLTAVFTSSLRKEVNFALTGTSPAPMTDDTAVTGRTVAAHLVGDDSSRKLAASGIGEDLSVYRPGDTIVIAYEYTGHTPLAEQEVFLSIVTGGGGETPVARSAFTTSKSGSGQVSVEFLVPWNRNYQGDGEDKERVCHFILRSSLDDTLATTTESFHILAFTERDSAFSAPASLTAGKHNEELHAGTQYTVRWKPALLWHYQQEPHQQRHGEHWQAEQVTFELVGEIVNSAGDVLQRTSYHDFGVHPNVGHASLVFPPEAVSTTKGQRFYLVIKAVRASYLQGWSSGYFRFFQGSDEISGLPLVSTQTMGIDAAFRCSSRHKVEHSRSFVSPQDFAASHRMHKRRLQGPAPVNPVDPVGPVNDGADACNGLISKDANFGMSGKAGIESLVGSVDFTSNMLSIPLGSERSKCVTDITSTGTGDTKIPASDPLDLNPSDIPAHSPIEPVPAPKVAPPPVIVPSPPNATALKGWLLTKIYPDCTIARSEPLSGQIMMSAEAVGLCIRVGESGDGTGGVYLLNDVDETTQEARTWFFSGPNGNRCVEEALISDDAGSIKYQAIDIALGECVKLGSSAQLHYSVTTFTNSTLPPSTDFGVGSGTVYWDQSQNCGFRTNITSFSITNPARCYAVQSIASLDSRQSTCSVSGANTTVRTYFSDTECTSGSNRVVSTIPFQNCAPSHFHSTTFGQTGYLPSADNYKSNFCDAQIPYTEENTGKRGGYSSGGTVSDDSLSAGVIAAIVVMVVTVALCLAVTVHYAREGKNPFDLWSDDQHHPGPRNWLQGGRPSSVGRATQNTSWLDNASGIAQPSNHAETRRSTEVITMDGTFPDNRMSALDDGINPLHKSQSAVTPTAPPSAPESSGATPEV